MRLLACLDQGLEEPADHPPDRRIPLDHGKAERGSGEHDGIEKEALLEQIFEKADADKHGDVDIGIARPFT